MTTDRPVRATAPDRMPVLVLTGFLGAGKTHFLTRLLDAGALEDSLVLVNEFGDAGLDGQFLQAETPQGEGLLIEELTSGCLCCTLQGSLVDTLEKLLRDRDNGRIAPFKQLVIETTGLADPGPILAAFAHHPYLAKRYLVGGIVTMVDAVQDSAALDANTEAVAQIATADILAISKIDLLEDDASLALLRDALTSRNGHALIAKSDALVADRGWIDDLLAQRLPAKAQPFVAPHDHDHKHHHSHEHDHDHDHHHHAASTVITHDEPLTDTAMAMFMDLVAMNFPDDLLRVKALVWIKQGDGPAEPWAFHAAGPVQHPPRFVELPLESDPVSRIVVITRTAQETRVQALFQACLRHGSIAAPAG